MLLERSGFSHIYQIGEDGLIKKQITNGEWVVQSIDFLDETNKSIYFTGNVEKPVLYGIYKVSLESGVIEQVSKNGGVHRAEFSPSGSMYVDTHSSLKVPPKTSLHNVGGKQITTLAKSQVGNYAEDSVTNDVFPLETEDGTILWAQLTRPAVFGKTRYFSFHR